VEQRNPGCAQGVEQPWQRRFTVRTTGKMAKEKNAKKKRKKKRKKDCQPRHRVKLNPLKAETAFRSQWKSMKDHTKEDHSNEQACEVLAKLVAVTSRARILRFPPWCKKSRFS
jgi:hypothetical protein